MTKQRIFGKHRAASASFLHDSSVT
jgi:hypothetical protein